MAWSDKYKKSIDCDNPKGFKMLNFSPANLPGILIMN